MAVKKLTDITHAMVEELGLPMAWIEWFQVLTTLLAGSYSGIPADEKFQSNIVKIVVKADTGDPDYGHEGLMCYNSLDNTLKIYAGGWRTISSW
jgi:hypothetical protein